LTIRPPSARIRTLLAYRAAMTQICVSLKQLIKRLAGDRTLGILDHYRFPEMRSSWGGPFNGQTHRQRMVKTFIRQLSLHAIVETGTYRGTTTAYLASSTQLPIYTVELKMRTLGFACAALWLFKNVQVYGGDSRQFLRTLAANRALRGKRLLFYLDAHWPQDLPLAEEIDIVFRNWNRALVLVDDFHVPDDSGYAYDNYGPGKALTFDYIRPAIRTFGLHTFFPSLPSILETGKKRGSVVLAADADLIEILRTMSEIRELSPGSAGASSLACFDEANARPSTRRHENAPIPTIRTLAR
jgi:hypothetical protein